MPIYQPRVNFSNFQQNNTTADAINSIASVFENNLANAENRKRQQLLDIKLQQAQQALDTGEAKRLAATQNEVGIDQQINTLADIFSPTLPDTLPAGVEGPVRPGVSVEEKLSDPANIGAINRAQFDLALKRGIKPQDVSNLLRSVAAQGQVENRRLQNFFAGAGDTLMPNEALTQDRQDEIRGQNQAFDIARDRAKIEAKVGGGLADSEMEPIPFLPYEQTILGQLEDSTGVGSAVKARVADLAGLVNAKAYPETVKARQAAMTFGNRLSGALRISPRFTEGERKDLKRVLSLEPDIFNAPLVAEQRLYAIDQTLQNLERKAANDLRDPYISKSDKSSQASNLRAIREARRELGVKRDPITGRRDDNKFDDISPTKTPATSGWSAEEIE